MTRLLSGHFEQVFAVESDETCERKLRVIPGTSVIMGKMEDVSLPSADIALLSYSLTGVGLSDQRDFLSDVFSKLNPGGHVVLVTYEEGCGWDEYAGEVYRDLGIERKGGNVRHARELNSIGFDMLPVKVIETVIWGRNLIDLFETPGFFFRKQLAAYQANRERYLIALERVALQSGRKVILPVREGIYEVRERPPTTPPAFHPRA